MFVIGMNLAGVEGLYLPSFKTEEKLRVSNRDIMV